MLSESARDGLLSVGAFREYSVGSRLFMEGDTSKHVIALHGGWVKVVAGTEEGGQALLALRSRGDLVGEQAAFEDEPRSATVISASPVRAYVIQQGAFLRYLADHPDVHIAVTRALSAKLRGATRRHVDFSGLPAHVRLARVLTELARMNSRPTGAGIELGYASRRLVYVPGAAAMTPALRRRLAGADVVLFDGTLFADDEMIASGTGSKTGRRMGHMPLDGADGTLAALAGLRCRRILTHINNTNPILIEGSAERRKVEQAGFEVAYDGMEIVL